MNNIQEDSYIVCDEGSTSSIPSSNTSATTNMVNSSFRDKGEVKQEDKEMFSEEKDSKVTKRKLQHFSCVQKCTHKFFGFGVNRFLMRSSSEVSHKSAGSNSSISSNSTGSKLADDIKCLLGQLVREKKLEQSSKSVGQEHRMITMNDISPAE